MKFQSRHDLKAPSHLAARLPKVAAGRSPAGRDAERRGFLVRSAGVGSHWPVRGRGGRQARAAKWLLP